MAPERALAERNRETGPFRVLRCHADKFGAGPQLRMPTLECTSQLLIEHPSVIIRRLMNDPMSVLDWELLRLGVAYLF
jgi:hypothetical protein